eukprot:snap_masked-scaffold_37-processed-gene-2.44-mRNA-1 protein AED:1.00 eAED:1.00 QI:0/-1/0/0/-1/1/1/0/60
MHFPGLAFRTREVISVQDSSKSSKSLFIHGDQYPHGKSKKTAENFVKNLDLQMWTLGFEG